MPEKQNEKRMTPWFRIQHDPNGWTVVQKEQKDQPRYVPGTEVYLNRVDAFNALARALALEFQKWD